MKPCNEILCGNALDVLSTFDSDFVDLTVFSPPYDNMRDYKGYTCDLHVLGEQLFRVTKEGGIVVMVIQDQTVNGWKTLTSFRTIVDWCDSIGFGLFECNIYNRHGKPGAFWSKRFRVDHEYMPIFIKGRKPNYFNKESIKIPSKHGGKFMRIASVRCKDGETRYPGEFTAALTKCRGTIWNYAQQKTTAIKRKHPAVYPDKIPYDFISVFTQKGDLVLDPMVGSGSTTVSASMLGRKYIGIDISKEYCEMTTERMKNVQLSIFTG